MTSASDPRLHPWAAKLTWKSELSKISLANILSGDTCTPISLTDLERHLTYNEHSVEALQFLVWFQDYRKRFSKLQKARSDFVFGTPSHAEIERRALESITKTKLEGTRQYPNIATAEINSTLSPTPPYMVNEDLLRKACSRAVATFLSPNATKELPVDAIVRDTVIRNLAHDCHPDVFLPVYEEAYNLLERHSLPRFLALASSNINRSHQSFTICIGCILLTLGLVAAILLITLLRAPPAVNRCWRLLAAFPFWLGSMACYSTSRGFCCILWLQGNKQLNAWEMQDMSEDTTAFVHGILGSRIVQPTRPNTSNNSSKEGDRSELTRSSGDDVKQIPGTSLAVGKSEDVVTIAPFTSMEPGDTIPSHGIAPRRTSVINGTSVFGPAIAVLDPKIEAVHRRVFGDMVLFGLIVLLVFSAIIFSIPGRRRASG